MKFKHCYVYSFNTCYSVTQSCPILCNSMDCRTPGFPVLHQLPELLKFMSIELVMPSNHLILCCPLLLLPSIFPSIMVFSNELALTLNKYTFDSYTWCFNIDTSQSLMLIQGLGKIFLFILLKNSFVGYKILGRYQFSSVAQSYPTLCNPMNHSTPGLPVHQ